MVRQQRRAPVRRRGKWGFGMWVLKRTNAGRVSAVGVVVMMGLAACSSSDSDSSTSATGAETTVAESTTAETTAPETTAAETTMPESTVAETAPETTAPETTIPLTDPFDLAPGESIVFAAEVTVTESNAEDLGVVGDVLWMPICYTLTADGVFIDPGFPNADAPVPGTWSSEWDGTTATYTAIIETGVVLEHTGLVTVDQATGDVLLTVEEVVTIASDGGLVISYTAVGPAVTDCEVVDRNGVVVFG
jgi:hypothetical protein